MAIDEQLVKMVMGNMMKDARVIRKNEPGFKELEKAQAIICDDSNNHLAYVMRPYLTTNQNQQYVQKLVIPEYDTACVITSSGDTLFEVIRNGITNVTAVDVNDLQPLIMNLRKASILTLNNSEFEDFLLCSNGINFLNHEMYDKFIKNELYDAVCKNFWDVFLSLNPTDDILNYFFKGGLERTDIYNIRQMLPYIKKRGAYMSLRNMISKAKINIEICEMVEFLISHPELKFDYIDFSNILLFAFQADCDSDLDKFSEYLNKLRVIFENNLNVGGTFVMDYMFGVNEKDLNIIDKHLERDAQLTKELYIRTYRVLSELFDLETMLLTKASQPLPLKGDSDLLLYTRKK